MTVVTTFESFLQLYSIFACLWSLFLTSFISLNRPLYFQHQGHSRTIIGIQVKNEKNGLKKYNLLVLDPAHVSLYICFLSFLNPWSAFCSITLLLFYLRLLFYSAIHWGGNLFCFSHFMLMDALICIQWINTFIYFLSMVFSFAIASFRMLRSSLEIYILCLALRISLLLSIRCS